MRVSVSIGSNAANAQVKVSAAVAIMAVRYGVSSVTPVFVTADITMAHRPAPLAPAPSYANAVAIVDMPVPPMLAASTRIFIEELKKIEAELGRRQEHKPFGLVNADIDLVTVGKRILRPVDFLRPYFFPYALVL